MRSTICALLFSCTLLPVFGQDRPPLELDLESVVREALASHPSLKGAGSRVEEARARLDGARAESAPKVSAGAGLTRYQDSPTLAAGSLGTIPLGGKDQKSLSAGIHYPLFTGGRLEAGRGQALAGVAASTASEARLRQKVALDATIAYYGVLKARSLAESAEIQLKALESQRHSISRLFDEGASTRVELLRADTAAAAAQEALQRSRNGESLALASLANTLGREFMPANVRVVERKKSPPARLAAFTPGDQASRAYLARPDLRQLEAEIKAAEAGIRMARSGDKPTVSVFAQYDAQRPSYQPDTGRWAAGIALNMSVFDGGATRADVSQARSRLAQVKAKRDELRNAIALQVTQAALNVQSARERLSTAQKGLLSADEGARLVQIGYENGVNTITDYLSTQAEQTRARNDQITAEYDLRAAEAELKFAIGSEPEI